VSRKSLRQKQALCFAGLPMPFWKALSTVSNLDIRFLFLSSFESLSRKSVHGFCETRVRHRKCQSPGSRFGQVFWPRFVFPAIPTRRLQKGELNVYVDSGYQFDWTVSLFKTPEADAYNFEGIASVMNLRMLIFITRKMQMFLDEKQWANLFVALGCFKDMVGLRSARPPFLPSLTSLVHQLISLETMETLGDDQRLHEVSEHMQHNLFYESARMDLIERMCKGFRPTINSRR
jgi:hypothetical protein